VHAESIRHLKRVDPVLASIIDRVGPCRLEPRREGTHFDALVRSIIYQQLSGKAAATIHARLMALYGNRAPTPAELLATSDEQLRAAGLSRQKLSYLQDLAAKTESGVVPLTSDAIDHLDDHEIVDRLVQVKGIGRWTVQMFLIFRLGRRDILPDLDLGIQNAIRRAYRMRKQPRPKDVLRIGEKWRPHASVASWYLWRSLEAGRQENLDSTRSAKPTKRTSAKPKRGVRQKKTANKRATARQR
jgi:3-methyladenine DNA glycosylase/8-oxoguanine DNA glycosylase